MAEQKLYTEEQLKTFDYLTSASSSRDQLTRIDARLQMAKMERELGSEVISAMHQELIRQGKW